MGDGLAQAPLVWSADGGAWALLVHGGAGGAVGTDAPLRIEGVTRAAAAGAEVLRAGGSALDAVQGAVVLLEDDPAFNAGTGACLDEEGLITLDASIMEGAALRAGGVCALPPFRHPIAIARAVLEDGRHVLYAAEGAARFAVARGFEASTREAMTSAAARAQWEAARRTEAPYGAQGTVGAVAFDVRGHVAAATSTGGIAGKRAGRVGDSPVPGAGTYADDEAGAASATGGGEGILRIGLTRGVVEALRRGTHPEQASREAIAHLRSRVQGNGGVIVVDRAGRLAWARGTASMAWAAAGAALPSIQAGT
jgi:beta-aspartyl-peptidase (threonine type)